MRLNCQIGIQRRMLPSANVKYSQMTATLCKRTDFYLIVSNTSNPSLMKLGIHDNLQIFSKFVKDGKCTLRFNEPPHDVLIKNADVIQLKGFLTVLYKILRKQDVGEINFSQPPTSVQKPKTKLCITSRKDYPSHGFPTTLIYLKLTGLKLCTVPKAILKLINLASLDLSDNVIKEANLSLAPLKNLSTLLLSKNKLEHICSFQLEKLTLLKVLDLSNNEISGKLPNSLSTCSNLTELNISHNNILYLPTKIGNLRKLRNLTLSHNLIMVLPASLFYLSLNHLDLFGNPLTNENLIVYPENKDVYSLLILAANKVAFMGTKFTEEELPIQLIKLLEELDCCLCGKPTLPSLGYSIFTKRAENLARSIILPNGLKELPVRVKLCSPRCKDSFLF